MASKKIKPTLKWRVKWMGPALVGVETVYAETAASAVMAAWERMPARYRARAIKLEVTRLHIGEEA